MKGSQYGEAWLVAQRSGAATHRLIGHKGEARGRTGWKDKAAAAQDYVRSHAEDMRDRSRGDLKRLDETELPSSSGSGGTVETRRCA